MSFLDSKVEEAACLEISGARTGPGENILSKKGQRGGEAGGLEKLH